jgi:hypothetical protein
VLEICVHGTGTPNHFFVRRYCIRRFMKRKTDSFTVCCPLPCDKLPRTGFDCGHGRPAKHLCQVKLPLFLL